MDRGVHIFWKAAQKDRDQFAQTPQEFMEWMERTYGKFDFDPCPANPDFDGLSCDWGNNNYVNPPYNNLKPWLNKAITEWRKGKQVVFLMPNRIHSKYFLQAVHPWNYPGGIELYVIPGGIKFKDYKVRAPFGMIYLLMPGSCHF